MKAAVEEPRAVIAVIDGLVVARSSALSLFLSVSTEMGQWPGIPLLLVCEDEQQYAMVVHHGVHRFVAVHPSVASAAGAVDGPPPRSVIRRKLPNSLGSGGKARECVREACAKWEVGEQTQAAVMIVNELVENTLLHTYCAPSLRVELRRGLLTVAVYDDDPAVPDMAESGVGRSRSGGLVIVTELSTAWGCSPTLAGGKVVWAALRT